MNQGLSDEEARSRIYLLDQSGLLGHTRSGTDVNQRAWVKHDQPDGTSLETLMETVKPGVLLGLTGFPGVFTEKSIRTMAAFTKRPIVFPLSNPTSRAEATAVDVYNWTEGRAIFASGSPFDPGSCTVSRTHCANSLLVVHMLLLILPFFFVFFFQS